MVSMRMSSGRMSRSISSASGSTATVAAEVWMRPLASVTGTRCTRCTPDSYLRRANTPLPAIDGHDLLVAAEVVLREADDLGLPAAQLGIAAVHAEQIGGEQGGLVAAGAGAHLEDGALLVGGVLGQQLQAQLLLKLAQLRGSSAASSSRAMCREFLVGRRVVDERRKIAPLGFGLAQRADGRRPPG